MTEQFEGENDIQRGQPFAVKAPTEPTQDEWNRHQTTHIPFASWCPHCLAARNVRRNHPARGRPGRIAPDTESGEGTTKVSINYMYLFERVGEHKGLQHNLQYFEECNIDLVDVGRPTRSSTEPTTRHNGCQKGFCKISRVVGWEQHGYCSKHQEPAVVFVQRAIQALKPDMISINSPVRGSAFNCRVENVVGRAQDKLSILRHQLERGIGQPMPDQPTIMPWTVRRAVGLLAKCAAGDDDRPPYERIRRETFQVPFVQFGATVMYLQMKTATASKGEPFRKPGAWFCMIERTEDTVIGTKNGVAKCRTMSRLANGNQWDKEMVTQMKGMFWSQSRRNVACTSRGILTTMVETQRETMDVTSDLRRFWMTVPQCKYVVVLTNSIYSERRLPSTG